MRVERHNTTNPPSVVGNVQTEGYESADKYKHTAEEGTGTAEKFPTLENQVNVNK